MITIPAPSGNSSQISADRMHTKSTETTALNHVGTRDEIVTLSDDIYIYIYSNYRTFVPNFRQLQ